VSKGHYMPTNNPKQNPAQQAAANAYNALMSQQAQVQLRYNTLLGQGGGAQNAYGPAQYHYGSAAANTLPKDQYMIAGVRMDFTTFINTLYPEDCAEKTFLVLKLSGEPNENNP